MSSLTLHRIKVTENRNEPRLVSRLAELTSQPEASVERLLFQAGERLARLVGHDQPPVRVSSSGTVRFEGMAGLLRLSSQMELEIVPKFLNGEDISWRQDFFRVALLSRTGKLLPREHLRADIAGRGDLTTLVGRTFAHLYWENNRRPIREYRSQAVHDYGVVGDLDPVGIVLPEAQGFRQTRLAFDHVNHWNEVISSAAGALVPEVSDGETRQQLLRVHQALAPQRVVRAAHHRRLPNRHHRWQALYDLSIEILNGFGVSYEEKHLHVPGYVMVMWSTWQHLCELALRIGLAWQELHPSVSYPLGTRNSRPLKVTPDIVVGPKQTPLVLVDAKYRTRLDRKESVSNDDIYESLAFMRAASTDRMILLYPRPASDGEPMEVGMTKNFQTIILGEQRIEALLVECRGISASQGFETFSHNLAAGVAGAQGL
ncbi:5-methylcytosine restriction system specificity protein McrC [Streptomyces albogriseolus]|uniref:5-methylcytosine restriction system specificity protein McrC n=1 Tax=Streptomyces albogriseolus TaxID=1887 RepID=UPI0036CAAC5E